MTTRPTWLACALVVASGGFTALSLTRGQEIANPAAASAPVQDSGQAPSATDRPGRDLSKLSPLQLQMYLGAQRGGDWLRRANKADGRFVDGYLPALKTPLEGDHFLRQAGAAYALARVAHFLGDERYSAVARQALLTLLLETSTEAGEPPVRHTTLPSLMVNRLASAGLLTLAINELPAPGDDLLEQSEQLCAYIRQQQTAEGFLSYTDPNTQAESDPEGVNSYPGEALAGLLASQRHRPAPWKLDVVRRALPAYRTWWQTHKTMAFVSWQTAAWTEAFLQTREKPFAEFVLELNDWLCQWQYVQLDPRHPLWTGGFMNWTDGKASATEPQVGSAAHAESLAQACRVARQVGDVARYQHYREALERSLQFVSTLQYTDANTQHFSDWYRPVLLGAFHHSPQDGNLRIDYTQHAVCAMIQYLENGVD